MKNKIKTASIMLAILSTIAFTACQSDQETIEGAITPQDNLTTSQSGDGGE